ncbi:MAG: M50 family metallopeptidase [Lachnospiraceae bacterium]|jgi:putative peptide zinc metalloprotease protein|nr:M50 family metallopeptidase [Lachnospiraceae bacterium]
MDEYDYIKVKPYEESVLDIEENDMWVLNFNDEKYLKVNTLTKNIISKFTGNSSLAEIGVLLKDEGIHISEEELKEFVNIVLKKNKIITGDINKKEFKFTFTLYFPLIDAYKLNFLFDKLKMIYSKYVAIVLAVFLGIIQIIALSYGGFDLYEQYKNNSGNAISVLVLFLIGTIIHEFGHATAARYYNARIGKIGIGLYLFLPVAYTDLTNIWKLDRWKRIVVNLGGLYFSLIYASILWIIGYFSNNQNLMIVNTIIFIAMIMNLNPLLRMDGHWVLNDFFGIVNVNKKMYEFILYLIKRLFGSNERYVFEKNRKKIYYVYFFCYMICNFVFLLIGIKQLIILLI